MGEIGIDRQQYLYDIPFWELLLISRGYANRHRDLWSSTRWMTFHVMSAMPYVDLKKNGIRKPTDLITFPWEHELLEINEVEISELQAEARQVAAELAARKLMPVKNE